MLEFKKYNSIENSFDHKFMEKVKLEMPLTQEYVVQEKVHGTNVSFICDGAEVKFAKRTTFVSSEENFYDFQELFQRYTPKVLNLFKTIAQMYENLQQITVFGEMFGGFYPHKSISPNAQVRCIQQGVYYTPNHEFYGFDIYIVTSLEEKYLSVNQVNALFEQENFFYAKTLFKGTLTECLAFPNAFITKVAEWLGFPPIEDNICEGVVIRPITPMYFRNGSRVLIKNKNERFSEKKKKPAVHSEALKPVVINEKLAPILAEIECYVTENRLANVLSHMGEEALSNNIFAVMGALSKDILADFLKEHANMYDVLEKKEQKELNKKINNLAMQLVKKKAGH